jgi:hypothetical protein
MQRKGAKSRFILKARVIRLLVLFVGLACGGLAADEAVTPVVVSPSEVAAQVGKVVTVRGRVDGQKNSKSGHTYLNFGGRYPNHVFSCFFNVKSFSEAIPMFEGKEVEVTGTVTMYQDKPQIEVSALSQIRVLEEEGSGSQESPAQKPTEPAS